MQSLLSLGLQESVVPAGGEWRPPHQTWTFLRLSSGNAYWRSRAQSFSVSPSDILVVGSGRADGYLLVSQVVACRVHHASLDPSLLKGLLTLQESMKLEELGRAAPGGAWRWSSGTPEWERASAVLCLGGEAGAVARFRFLAGVLELLYSQAPPRKAEPQAPANPQTKERLRVVLHQLTEADLIRLSLNQLATRLACSPRHFSRLFGLIHGVSFRDKQQELRLALARQLLETTDNKIVHVALESGYQSVGLFNAMFKRRYGVTPTECRRAAHVQRAERAVPPPSRRVELPAIAGGPLPYLRPKLEMIAER